MRRYKSEAKKGGGLIKTMLMNQVTHVSICGSPWGSPLRVYRTKRNCPTKRKEAGILHTNPGLLLAEGCS